MARSKYTEDHGDTQAETAPEKAAEGTQEAFEPAPDAEPQPVVVKSQKQLLMESAKIDEGIREEKLERMIDMADQARKRRRR